MLLLRCVVNMLVQKLFFIKSAPINVDQNIVTPNIYYRVNYMSQATIVNIFLNSLLLKVS